jgi:hypothetical protein
VRFPLTCSKKALPLEAIQRISPSGRTIRYSESKTPVPPDGVLPPLLTQPGSDPPHERAQRRFPSICPTLAEHQRSRRSGSTREGNQKARQDPISRCPRQGSRPPVAPPYRERKVAPVSRCLICRGRAMTQLARLLPVPGTHPLASEAIAGGKTCSV